MGEECVFCGIVAGELPSYVVAEDDGALAILDINPMMRGHTLVLPKRHVVDIFDGGGEALADLAPTIQRVARMMADKLDAAGVNLLQSSGRVAGQDVFHLHVHVLPRWKGDAGSRAFAAVRGLSAVRRRVPLRPGPDLAAVHRTLVD